MSLSRASSAAQIDRRTVANKKPGISNDRGADRNISRQLLRSGNDYFSQNSSHSTASSTRAHSTAHNYSTNRTQVAKPEQKPNISSFKTTEKTSNIIQSVVHQHHQHIQSNLQKSWKQPFQKQPQPYQQSKPIFPQQLSYQQLSQTQKQQDPYEDQLIQKSTCCFSPKCSGIKPSQKKEFKPLNFDHITFRQSQEECICETNLLLKQSFQSSPSNKQFNNSKETLQQHLQQSQKNIQQSESSTSMPIPIINSACSSPTNASLNYYSTKNQHKKPSPGSSPSNSTSARSPMILGASSRQSSNDSKQTAMAYNHPVIQSQQLSSMKNTSFTSSTISNLSIPGSTTVAQHSLTPSNSATNRILEIKQSQQSQEQPKIHNKKPPSSLASVHQQFTLQYLQQLKQATNHIQYQHQSASPFNKCTSNEFSSKELGSLQHCFPVSSALKEQASPRAYPNNNNNKTTSINPSPRHTSVLMSSLSLNQPSQAPITDPNKNILKINNPFFKEQDEILNNEVVVASKDVANKLKQDIQQTTSQQGNQNLYVKFTNKNDACNNFYYNNNSNQDSFRKLLEPNEGHRILHIDNSSLERNNDFKTKIKFQNSQTNQSPSSPSSPLFRCNYQNNQLSQFQQQSLNNFTQGQLAQKANPSSETQKHSLKMRQQQSLESKPIRENRYIEKPTPRTGIIATITSAAATTTNTTNSIPQGQQYQQEQQSPTFFPCIPPSLNGEQSFSLSNDHPQLLQLSNKNNISKGIISQDIQITPKTEEDAISSLLFVQKEFKSGNRIGDSLKCFRDEKLEKNCIESETRTNSTTVTTARSPKSCNSNSSHNNNNINTSVSSHSQFIGSFQNDAKKKQENFSAADSAAKSSNESILSTNRQSQQQPQEQLHTIQLRITRALSSHLEKEEILKKQNDSLKTQLAILSSTVASQAAQIALQQTQIAQITQTQSIQQQPQEHLQSSEDNTKYNSSPKNQLKEYFQQTLHPLPPAAHSFQTQYSLQQQNTLKPASSHNTNDNIDPLQMTFFPSPFEISFQQAKLNENNNVNN